MSNKYTNTFKRYEKKYLLYKLQYAYLREDLRSFMDEDEYGKHTICNLYYDTNSFEIIRRSIEKPHYKEKLRLRSYGVPTKVSPVFFELKKKYNKEVFKRRVSLSIGEVEEYLENKKCESQILKEIDWFTRMYHVEPRVFIAYDRMALFGKDNNDIRVTFDTDIRFRTSDLCLSKGDHGTAILAEDQVLMEIKIQGAMPIWLSDILANLCIFPNSFSKYGHCYKHHILKETIEKNEKNLANDVA